MNTNRKIAIMAGALFIIADVATFTGDALIPALTGVNYLIQLSTHANLVAAGALAKIISAFASVGIAIAMYPVMKRANAGLALGSVVFRTLEAAFYMVGVVSLLALLKLSQQFAAAGVGDHSSLQAIGDSLVSIRLWAASLLGVFAFCVGSFMYNYLFFQSRLIPRWLSGFGIAVITSLTIACGLSLFSGNRITSYISLAFPIFLQELVLAVWLIVKGFTPFVSVTKSGKLETKELLSAQ